MVNLENVSLSYRQEEYPAVVLENISLNIREGECLVIIGGSGCGKTTLLKVIAGLQKPDSGRVLFENREVTRPLKDISVIFQDYGLFPWKTVEENIRLPLKLRRATGRDGEVRDLLARLGLAEQAKRYPCQLSGGQRQRTAIGRALLGNARMLLLDEPFSALDPMTKERMYKYVKQLLGEKYRTSVIVTHSAREAAMFGDRIAIFSKEGKKLCRMMDNGHVRQPGYEQTEEFEQMKKKIRSIMLGGLDEAL